jgi:formate hydrogenlyase subunit 3/multisubunit Na+/H+ antiporter MnhD subunit
MVPWLLVRPVFGAVMGMLLFAGFVGGFLIATTETPQKFSPAGLLFLSLLSGLFAKTFVARLRVMFKTLLGDTEETAKSGDDEDVGAAERAKRTKAAAAGTAAAPARGAPGT